MQLGTLVKLVLRSCSAALIVAVAFAAGCDRATPELQNKKAAAGADDNDKASGKDERSISQKIADDMKFGSDDSPSNEVSGATGERNRAEVDSPSETNVLDQADLSNRTFITLKPVTSEKPADLEAHLKDVDTALRDLILAATNKIVSADIFNSSGMRLGQMKLTTGEKLASLPDATAEQRKLGTVSQLVALSHMSGLKDMESAKKLEKFAGTLQQSSDPDLAHQGLVVLLGFKLQEFQNGIVSDPAQLLLDLKGLFQRPSDAGFPEMMVLMQAQSVFDEMGFAEAAGKIDQLVVDHFMDSPDLQLSSTAWNLAVGNSQWFGNYNSAKQDIYEGKEKEPQMLLGAARSLYEELPNSITLLQFSKLSADLEYRGLANISSELSAFVKSKSASLQDSPYSLAIADSLQAQDRRLGIRGQQLELDELIDFDGKPLDWSAYKGKVVLIDFWATWCRPCLLELPNIRKAKEEFASANFEVLSINMDEDLPAAREFLTSNPLPWKTFHSNDPSAIGFKSAIAKRLGINAIPFLVLVGPDGKVGAIHVRGDRIAPSVRSMLGDGLSN